MTKIYVPRESFVTAIDGEERTFSRGRTTVEEGHPVLSGREQLFEEQRIDYPAPQRREQRQKPKVTITPA